MFTKQFTIISSFLWTAAFSLQDNYYRRVWHRSNSSLPIHWQCIDSDATGQHLIAGSVRGDNLDSSVFTSDDYGQSWIRRGETDQKSYYMVSVDATAQYYQAGKEGAWLMQSIDHGADWTQYDNNILGWVAIHHSTQLMAAATIRGGYMSGWIYRSYNHGRTWTPLNFSPNAWWTGIAGASDNTGILVGVTRPHDVNRSPIGGIYVSKDRGERWTKTTAPDYDYSAVISDSRGERFVVACTEQFATGPGLIYTSSNSGSTWTKSPTIFLAVITGLAGDQTGQFLAATTDGGGIHLSNDFGMMWVASAAPIRAWKAITSDVSGNYYVAVADRDGIYTFNMTATEDVVGPSASPTLAPTSQDQVYPTPHPTAQPTEPLPVPDSPHPSPAPSRAPTAAATVHPTAKTTSPPSTPPSRVPTVGLTASPSVGPSAAPTMSPSTVPSAIPSEVPSAVPSAERTTQPSLRPSVARTAAPTPHPTPAPTARPSAGPSHLGTDPPQASPTRAPSRIPTMQSSARPSVAATTPPSQQPSAAPTSPPSVLVATRTPTGPPSMVPTAAPTAAPTAGPTSEPTVLPTPAPSAEPTDAPVPPTSAPTTALTLRPSPAPTAPLRSVAPTALPTPAPSIPGSDVLLPLTPQQLYSLILLSAGSIFLNGIFVGMLCLCCILRCVRHRHNAHGHRASVGSANAPTMGRPGAGSYAQVPTQARAVPDDVEEGVELLSFLD